MGGLRHYIDLVEAASSTIRQRPYWHGTDNKSGQKILAEGFRSGVEIVKKRSATYLPPVYDGVYLTPDPLYALDFTKTKQKYGWLFRIDGSALSDLQPDEDEIGLTVRWAFKFTEMPNVTPSPYDQMKHATCMLPRSEPFRTTLLDLAEQHLPDDLKHNLRAYNRHSAKWFSDAGRILAPVIPDGMMQQMLDAGCHAVHPAPIQPSAAWRFPPDTSIEINNGYLRQGLSVLDTLAERML